MRWKNLDIVDKIMVSLSFSIRAAIIIAIVEEVLNENWWLLFLTSIILLITFIPGILQRNYKIILPTEVEIMITLFIYMTLFLGEIRNYYLKFFWWDILLHSFSGMVLGLLGFLIVYVLYTEKKFAAKPLFVAIFAFCFSVAIGSLWEIVEFGVDAFFKTNMQLGSLQDTMADLIVDSLGALIISAIGFIYIKTGEKHSFFIFRRIIKKFVQKNPHLFLLNKKVRKKRIK